MKICKKQIASLLLALLFAQGVAANADELNMLANANSLMKQEKYAEVVSIMEELPSANLSFDHYKVYVAAAAAMDLDDAEDVVIQALENIPNDPDTYLLHASIMGRQAQNSMFSALSYASKALKSLKMAVDLAPSEPKYRLALMSFYLAAPSIAGGDEELAYQEAQSIAQLDKIYGYIALARYYQSTGDTEKAKEKLQVASESNPDNVNILDSYASVLVQTEEYGQAIEVYNKITNIPMPELNENIDDLEPEALENEKQLRLNSHYQIGRVALLGNLKHEEGISSLQKYLNTLKVTDVDVRGLPSSKWAHLRIAGLLFATKQYQASKEKLDTLVVDKNDDNMKSVFKELKKELKSAL